MHRATKKLGRMLAVPHLAFALELREKHGKPQSE